MNKTLNDFFKKTKYNISEFFESFVLFSNHYYANIVNYYNGANIDKESFLFLDFLYKESQKLETVIEQYSNSFDTIDYWEIVNLVSKIQSVLETCYNMGRWQRSSRLNRYSSTLKINHIQKQNETLEKIAIDAGMEDIERWVDIAIDNQIEEEDYTNKGGLLLNVKLPNTSNFNLENIIDYLVGKNVYGKDIKNDFKISSDGGLVTIEGKENLKQIFETIMSTYKGGIPEFPEDGMPSEIFGTNENVIQYPILFRSILNMLQKDKRFTSLDLLDIRKEEDNVFIEMQVKTITSETMLNNIII